MDRNTIEIHSVPETRADLVAMQVELALLNRYPLPNKNTVDRGKELLAEFKTIMANDYGIPCSSISVRNPQANSIVERVHQTIGNIVCTFTIQQIDLDNENPNSLIYHVCHTVYGTHYYTAYTVKNGIW